jgi:type VI secretion system protein ImpM
VPELTAAGWHGKLPTLGDFATRRLAPEFIEAWDAWLSDGLAAMRAQADWPAAYLASPSWRFLLMPGALPASCGERAWVGVLMPSVDRVGRYYPLTLAHPLAAVPAASDELDALWRWLAQLDDAAVNALHDDWDLDALETQLARIGVPTASATGMFGAPDAAQALPFLAQREPAVLLSPNVGTAWRERVRGQAFWYAESGLPQPTLVGSQGLEPGGLVPRLFGAGDAAPVVS